MCYVCSATKWGRVRSFPYPRPLSLWCTTVIATTSFELRSTSAVASWAMSRLLPTWSLTPTSFRYSTATSALEEREAVRPLVLREHHGAGCLPLEEHLLEELWQEGGVPRQAGLPGRRRGQREAGARRTRVPCCLEIFSEVTEFTLPALNKRQTQKDCFPSLLIGLLTVFYITVLFALLQESCLCRCVHYRISIRVMSHSDRTMYYFTFGMCSICSIEVCVK